MKLGLIFINVAWMVIAALNDPAIVFYALATVASAGVFTGVYNGIRR